MSRDGSPKKTADKQSGSGRPEGIPGEADIGREVGQVGDFRRHHDGPMSPRDNANYAAAPIT